MYRFLTITWFHKLGHDIIKGLWLSKGREEFLQVISLYDNIVSSFIQECSSYPHKVLDCHNIYTMFKVNPILEMVFSQMLNKHSIDVYVLCIWQLKAVHGTSSPVFFSTLILHHLKSLMENSLQTDIRPRFSLRHWHSFTLRNSTSL